MPNDANAYERTNRNAKNADTDTVTDTVTDTDRLNTLHEVFPGKVKFTFEDLREHSQVAVIAMSVGFSKEKVATYLEAFGKARAADLKTYDSMTDLFSHFRNFCRTAKIESTKTTINKSINGKPQ